VYYPRATSAKTATFRLAHVRAREVRSGALRGARMRRALPVRAVRRAARRGRLVVRLAGRMRRPHARRHLRLMLRLRAARKTGATSTPTTTCAPRTSAYSSAVLSTTGVAGYWRLGESAGAVACDSKVSNPGTYSGGYTLAQGGAISSDADTAAGMSGTGRVAVPSSAALAATGQLSVEAWVNPTSASTSQTVARKEGQYLLRVSGGRLVFRVWQSGGTTVELTSPAVVASGVYQHVVGTADGNRLRVYRNGQLVAEQAFSGQRAASGYSLLIGTSEGYDGFKGRLDEVAVYNAALAPATIASHWAVGSGTVAPTPTDPTSPPSTSPPPSGDCTSVFGVGSWPPACWRPFGPNSPFNKTIPDNPRLHPNSSAIVQRMVSLYGGPGKMTAGDADSVYDYSHPLYYPKSTDPVFTLHCYETSWGTCPIEGHQIRIPDAARPAGGGDAHLTVIDQASGWEYDLYKVRSKPAGGGTLEFRWGGRTRLDGDGLGSNATAAHFGLSAGIIRAQEMAAGKIDHALFMVVRCTSGKVYPAGGGGAQCADPTNAPSGGMRFQLAYSAAEIDALPVPQWKKTILHALRTYGAYIGDTGGGGFNFQFESGSTYTSFGQSDKLVDWAAGQPGVALYNGKYVFDVASGVNWSRMRVIDPCVAQGTC
jgi:hypothetical protein